MHDTDSTLPEAAKLYLYSDCIYARKRSQQILMRVARRNGMIELMQAVKKELA